MGLMKVMSHTIWILGTLWFTSLACFAQWEMQNAHATASFRGIHAVNDQIAWASGTEGTVLRTVDGGQHWQRCATPPDAEKLDFRAIWAWSADEAEAMSAGPGELSRLYQTIDGCKSWKEIRRNQDKDGFWEALIFRHRSGLLIGDPLNGHFDTHLVRATSVESAVACSAHPGEAAFAASNSSAFLSDERTYVLVTGGKGGPRALFSPMQEKLKGEACKGVPLPLASGGDSAGAFSVYFRDRQHGVVVGGDYKKPEERAGTAAFTNDGGKTWKAARRPPHGYRSSVTWDAQRKVWIAAGTNGSDYSQDDGQTWKPLDDGEWNALSLPFVVGPSSRIGILKSIPPQRQ